MRDIVDESRVEFAQSGRERRREVVGVELAGQMRPAQREQEIDDPAVPQLAKTKEATVDGSAIVVRPLKDGPGGDPLLQLAPAERCLVLCEFEIVSDALRRHEEPRLGISVLRRRGADTDRHVFVAVAELHPHVPGAGVVPVSAGPVVIVTAE